MVIRNKLINKKMIVLGRKSTNRSKIVAKGWCQYLDIFSDIAHHHVTRVSRSSDSSSKCYFAVRFSMFRLNIAHNPHPIWGYVRILSAECFALLQNKAVTLSEIPSKSKLPGTPAAPCWLGPRLPVFRLPAFRQWPSGRSSASCLSPRSQAGIVGFRFPEHSHLKESNR